MDSMKHGSQSTADCIASKSAALPCKVASMEWITLSNSLRDWKSACTSDSRLTSVVVPDDFSFAPACWLVLTKDEAMILQQFRSSMMEASSFIRFGLEMSSMLL